jgi:hypothetical protein
MGSFLIFGPPRATICAGEGQFAEDGRGPSCDASGAGETRCGRRHLVVDLPRESLPPRPLGDEVGFSEGGIALEKVAGASFEGRFASWDAVGIGLVFASPQRDFRLGPSRLCERDSFTTRHLEFLRFSFRCRGHSTGRGGRSQGEERLFRGRNLPWPSSRLSRAFSGQRPVRRATLKNPQGFLREPTWPLLTALWALLAAGRPREGASKTPTWELPHVATSMRRGTR